MGVEIERKFDAPAEFVLPAADVLAAALDKAATGREDGTVELAATYYDTADFRLARSKVTLRRRTGGKDAGWHLKLPGAADEREEVTAPLGRAGVVPAALRPLVVALARGRKLAPVATLNTTRRVVTLLDAAGSPAIEVVEDEVTATQAANPKESETLARDRGRDPRRRPRPAGSGQRGVAGSRSSAGPIRLQARPRSGLHRPDAAGGARRSQPQGRAAPTRE